MVLYVLGSGVLFFVCLVFLTCNVFVYVVLLCLRYIAWIIHWTVVRKNSDNSLFFVVWFFYMLSVLVVPLLSCFSQLPSSILSPNCYLYLPIVSELSYGLQKNKEYSIPCYSVLMYLLWQSSPVSPHIINVVLKRWSFLMYADHIYQASYAL